MTEEYVQKKRRFNCSPSFFSKCCFWTVVDPLLGYEILLHELLNILSYGTFKSFSIHRVFGGFACFAIEYATHYSLNILHSLLSFVTFAYLYKSTETPNQNCAQVTSNSKVGGSCSTLGCLPYSLTML